MKLIQLVYLVLLIGVLAGCDRSEPGGKQKVPVTVVTSQGGTEGKVEWVDPATVQRGPIQRETLTEEEMGRIRRLQGVFAEVEPETVEEWVDDFKRDLDPDRELAVWEEMAKAYTGYCAKHVLTLEGKKEVFKVVLLRSMAPEGEVYAHLELKVLTKEEAGEVMRGY